MSTDPRPRPGGPGLLGGAAAAAAAIAAIAASGAAAAGAIPGFTAAAIVTAVSAGLAFVVLRTSRRARRRAGQAADLAQRLEDAQDRIWELAESLDRQRDLVEAQGDAIVRRDPEGRLTFANDAFFRTFGLDRDAVLGTRAMPRPLDGAPRGATAARSSADARYHTGEGERWFAWQDIPIRDNSGNVVEIQSVGRDVTARKETEAALRRARDEAEAGSRAKSRFLAAVSHEIRTPMNGIIGMTDLLLETGLTAEQTTYARAVHDSASALLGLIDEILDFSRIEAGRLELSSEPFSLTRVAGDVAELLAPRAEDKGLEIAARIARDVPPAVIGDADRLRQVLVNLAGNGIKFTDRGGVAIEVQTRPGADGAHGILIVVRDTGIGIPDDAQGRIFEEFEQADAGPARLHGGAGLGLAICRRIVEAMGGSITVGSRPGRGSAFSVWLPLGAADDASGSVTGPPPRMLAGRRILVASPSAILRETLARTLKEVGAKVDTAARAATLARRLEVPGRIDCALVDLPFAERIDPRLVPSIVLLSPRSRRLLPDLMARGFSGYLVKPIRSQSLFARLGVATAGEGRQPAGAAKPGARTRRLDVLLAEDNDLNAMLTTALLRRLGHRVRRARDGRQAVNKVKAAEGCGRPFDLVFMDVQMPRLDGLAAAREIRSADVRTREGRRLVIVALTANAFAEDRAACLAAGMDMFLTKPVGRDALDECLERAASCEWPHRAAGGPDD